jgi:hypothetical protein
MNASDFFEDLESKNWKQQIESKASFKFDELIEFLKAEKENILDETISDLQTVEKFLAEDGEEYTYAIFKKWLNKTIRENIAKTIDGEEE